MVNEKVVAFAHGGLKFLPDYLGGQKTGVVTHIFVKASYRHRHIGHQLLSLLEGWFKEKKVHSIELQVIAGNDAREFWEKSGYSLELYQYRKFPGDIK
jgi:GNAT superfamily N-acetyltransferase